ncbi:MAG TPA: UpxY family transcription antiterminator [Syntrophales bacterium]|jgi:transcription antitermination factor NusG|nr:UpxY family transcription antiterminator [Syntrophales bacterium]HPX55047.1 UpxY family transcription antiterminator [Syntrophales bacterium]HQA81917.1 UpxY family transcription antiterminator [Syntrophales bacterium]
MSWYAVHTKSRHESKVYDKLLQKSLHAFLPRISVWSRRKDRKKKIIVPLFPGYLFIRVDDLDNAKMIEILKTAGVVRILGNRQDGPPAAVPEKTMDTIYKLVASENDIRQIQYPRLGEAAVIVDGPFKGIEGHVVKTDYANEIFIISFEFLNRYVSIPLQGHQIQKI